MYLKIHDCIVIALVMIINIICQGYIGSLVVIYGFHFIYLGLILLKHILVWMLVDDLLDLPSTKVGKFVDISRVCVIFP